MLDWTEDELTRSEGSHPGVDNLLTAMKVQLHAALVCVALRRPDGRFSIATSPSVVALPPWNLEMIEDLMDEVWADPGLTTGRLMVRVSHLPTSAIGTDDHPLRVVAAPLRWLEGDSPPWGLLCLLQPPSGYFDQEQSDLLARFVARMVAYFDARQEVLDAGPYLVNMPRLGGAEIRRSTLVLEKSDRLSPHLDGESWNQVGGDGDRENGKRRPKGKKRKDKEKAGGGVRANSKRPSADLRIREPRIRGSNMRTGELDEIAIAVDEGRCAEDLARRPVAFSPSPLAGVMEELKEDPVTGLGGLPSLFGELGVALGAQGSEGGDVLLILLYLTSDSRERSILAEHLAVEVVRGLRSHVRDGDAVFRIDERIFAVVSCLRPGVIPPSDIEERLAKALRSLVGDATAGWVVRLASVGAAELGGSPTSEELFRQVALALDG